MTEEDIILPEVTTKQKKQLKALGHHLEPVVYVGKEGLSTALIQATQQALKTHELIKVKLGQNCPVEKKKAAELLATQSKAALIQLIGKMVLLYSPNTKLPDAKRVML